MEMSMMSWSMVVFCLGIVWAGYRKHKVKKTPASVAETVRENPKQTRTVSRSDYRKMQQRNRRYRRRMSWAYRRLVLYPGRCRFETKHRALSFIAMMLQSGPAVLKRQGLAILREMVETNSRINSWKLRARAEYLLSVYDKSWQPRNKAGDTIIVKREFKIFGADKQGQPQALSEAA